MGQVVEIQDFKRRKLANFLANLRPKATETIKLYVCYEKVLANALAAEARSNSRTVSEIRDVDDGPEVA